LTIGAVATIMARMRTLVPGIAVLVAAAFAATVSLAGCKRKEESAQQAGSAQAVAQDAGAAQKRAGRPRNPLFGGRAEAARSSSGLEKLTREEIQPIVPSLTGAVPTGRPMVTTGGRQINVVHCLPQNDPAKIKAEFKQKLEALGYGSIRFRDNPKRDRPPKELVRVTAEKAPYRLTVAVQSAPFFNCKESEKKVKLVMQFFKRDPSAPADAGKPDPAMMSPTPGLPRSPAKAQAPAKAEAPASSPK
jgi:hypothetical protein